MIRCGVQPLVLFAALAMSAIACTGGQAVTEGASQTAGPSGAVEQAITGFNGGAEDATHSFAAIHKHLRARPAELRRAALHHVSSDDASVHYAALYALAVTAEEGESMQALAAYLNSRQISERMLAAGSLLVRGDAAAIPVLIAALDSPEPLAYRESGEPAWLFAQNLLVRYTGERIGPPLEQPQDFDPAAVAGAQADWQRWWTEHGADLVWDPIARQYRQESP